MTTKFYLWNISHICTSSELLIRWKHFLQFSPMLLELTCFGLQGKRRNSSIVKLLSICNWKGWHYLRYLKLCNFARNIRGRCPAICHGQMLGQSIETGQGRRWSWTKVQEALNCCHIREQWPRPRKGDGGSTTVSSLESSQFGYLTGASRKHSDPRARFEDGASTMGPSPFEPKTKAQSLTMCAGNLELFGVDQDNFWALFIFTGAIPGPSTTSWIQKTTSTRVKDSFSPTQGKKDSLGFLSGFSGNFKDIAGGLSPKWQDHQFTV